MTIQVYCQNSKNRRLIVFILLVLANVVLAVIFKFFDKYGVNNLNAIVVNYFVCVITASLFLGDFSIPAQFYLKPWFGCSVILSLLFIFGFNLMALSFQKAGVALTAIIQKMSLIISAGFAIIFYNEALNTIKIFGFLAALLTIVLVNYPDRGGIKLKSKWVIMLPLIVFALSGIIEVLLYYVEVTGLVVEDGLYFTSTSFGLAGVWGALYIGYALRTNKTQFVVKDILGGLVLGFPNFFSIYLIVYLLSSGWDGSILFPLNNVSILVLTTMTGAFLFKERVSIFKMIGLVFGIIAIILISSS